jgi:hypothetical protein
MVGTEPRPHYIGVMLFTGNGTLPERHLQHSAAPCINPSISSVVNLALGLQIHDSVCLTLDSHAEGPTSLLNDVVSKIDG